MTRLVWLVLIVFLTACDGRAPKASDPYDPAKMDLKPKPARVTNAAVTGPFAAGKALSMTASLKPLDPGAGQERFASTRRTRSSRSRRA